MNITASTELVYSTTTTGDNFAADEYTIGYDHEPHCYECGRHTDHFAEHDSLVTLGLVSYSPDGDVYVTDFARSEDGILVRAAYDRAIDRGIRESRGGRVTLVKPEGSAITYAMTAGIALPGRVTMS